MGICWSEPLPVGPSHPTMPPQQTTVVRTYPGCKSCGGWIKQPGLDYCEACLQRNAMKVITPSAPPPMQPQYQYQQQYPQYTYAVQQQQYPQYTYAVQQPQQPYYPPQQYPPQQRQMGPMGALATGFVVGAVMEDILDPMD